MTAPLQPADRRGPAVSRIVMPSGDHLPHLVHDRSGPGSGGVVVAPVAEQMAADLDLDHPVLVGERGHCRDVARPGGLEVGEHQNKPVVWSAEPR